MWLPRTLARMTRILAAYKSRREVVHPPPLRLWVESASRCNLRCEMCPNKDMPPEAKGLMPLSLFRKIVDEAKAFASDMYLHHRGEPLLNPALFDMIAYARKAGLGVRFHTNGTLLDGKKAERLIQAQPDLVSVSIDGFEKKTYERIRRGAVFETTVGNVVEFAERRRAAGARRPYLVVEKIRFRNPDPAEDKDAVAALRARFLDAGVDEVIEKEEYEWAEGRESASAIPPHGACTFPWYAMVICADGTVTPCPQDFWAAMPMGNAAEESLLAIWNGPAYRDLRRRFREDLLSLPLCRNCDRLRRKTRSGIPVQYLATFLVDHLVGYNRRLRRRLGTAERN